MNFLGHSMISLEIDEKYGKKTLYGNFAGDFYKGVIEKINLPDELKEGLVLHRMIDSISDKQENYLDVLLIRKFGIFKGIVSDMFIDHFLSRNFYRLFNENINDIETKILYNINQNSQYFSEDFKNTFKWINSERILSGYGDIDILKRAFYGLSRRIRKGEILNFAVEELKKNYNIFEENSIKEFEYVKKESINKFLNKY